MNSIRSMRLDENQAQALLEEYTGPRNEMEKQTMVFNPLMFWSFEAYSLYHECLVSFQEM